MVKEPFQDTDLLQDIWGKPWGAWSETGAVKEILIHRPGEEILALEPGDRGIEAGLTPHLTIKGRISVQAPDQTPIDLDTVRSQHRTLEDVLIQEGIVIHYLQGSVLHWSESLFTRDMGMIIPGGAIITRPALYIRYGEAPLLARTLGSAGMPILGTIHGNGYAEGGSFMMLDSKTALIGRSERVNLSGIEQVRQILSVQGIELLVIDLPSTIIHLDEAFMMVDEQKALVDTALLPYWFLEELSNRKIQLLHVDPADPQLTINALTLSPGKVIMPSSGQRTIELLEKHHVKVIPVDISEILKLGGGIHCLTLPLIRVN